MYTSRSELQIGIALIVMAAVILWWRWVGYQGHDDAYYAEAASAWVQHAPSLGTNHWALRYPLVLPTAVLIKIFGPSLPVYALVDVTAYLSFLILGYAAARHWFGIGAAVALTVIGIVLPQFPVQATYANPDMLEMSFIMGSFWLLMFARQRGGPWLMMLGAGLLAGLAFLTRETTLALFPLYGFMFLFQPAVPRWKYLLVAAGFVLIVGAQMGWFALEAGDPLYRFRISATHDTVDRAGLAGQVTGALDKEGVLVAGLFWGPILALFLSQKYGLLFYYAVFSSPWLLFKDQMNPQARLLVIWSIVGSITSFLFVALNVSVLYIVPRYFMVTAAMASIPIAVLAGRLYVERSHFLIIPSIVFVSSCVIFLNLENVIPMFAEQSALSFASEQTEVI